MKIVLALCLAATASLGSTAAFADESAGYDIEDQGADYAVSFFDDNVDGSHYGVTGGDIKIRPTGVRQTMLRPRTTFLRALIRSVEQL